VCVYCSGMTSHEDTAIGSRGTDRQGYVAIPVKSIRYWPITVKLVNSVAKVGCCQITDGLDCHSKANRNTA
jgi:hypothetical protein